MLPIAAAAVVALILLTWVLSASDSRDASMIDPVWGPAFVLVALIAALAGTVRRARRWLLLALTAIWGLRLGVHLTRRKLAQRGEDRRYSAMRARHPHNFASWSLIQVYGLQAALIVVISLPVQVSAQRPGALTWAIAPGLALFAVGVLFEAVGDEQLRRFKPIRATPARSWIAACGGTPATPTTSVTPVSGGACG